MKTERPPEEDASLDLGLREFFKIVSSLFSLEEQTPQVDGLQKGRDDLVAMLRALPYTSEILDDLEGADDGVFVVEDDAVKQNTAGLYLMRFDVEGQVLSTHYYGDRLADALDVYDACEDDLLEASSDKTSPTPYVDVVLAYARTNDQLKLAYPNYSTRVGSFVSHVRSYL